MFEKKTYTERRRKLAERLQGGLILLMGNTLSPMNYADNTFPFRQDSSFLYFFGLDAPGLAAVIDTDNGEEMIFGNDAGIDDMIWMGPQVSLQERAWQTGVHQTFPFTRLGDVIKGAVRQGRKIRFLPPYRAENKLTLQEVLGIRADRLSYDASCALIREVVALRSVKEPCEVEEMKKAWAIGSHMHKTAFKMARPGVWEQTIAGAIDSIPVTMGGMPAYPTVLTQHGEILHNQSHIHYLKEGRLLLIDAGAENNMHYASDFTRTLPVGGKFTLRQREIYEIVLAANNDARERIRPGVTFRSVHLAVARLITSKLMELGLMKGDVDEAVANGAHALLFPHGVGHMIGLDVHDMEDLGQIHVGFDDEVKPSNQFGTASLRLGRELRPGFTITNEPGIYFIPALIDKWKKEKINTAFISFKKLDNYRDFGGIRLEDNLLVSETGCELLGDRLPITVEEVEGAMNFTKKQNE